MQGRAVLIDMPSIRDMCDAAEAELKKKGLPFVRHAGIPAFKAAKNPLADGDLLFVLGLPCTRELMSSAKLRAVVSPFTGTDFIDVPAATELGIVVGHGQVPENGIGMAESTIMMMLACLYDLHRNEKLLRENLPRPPRFAHLARGKTAGLIGFGDIGKGIAARLAGWDMKILAHTPRLKPPLPHGVEAVSLDELLARSDVVMIVASLNAETKDLLNAKRLAQMKKDAILINTSRGGIVNENDLVDVMARGHLAYTALDVFETEPLPPDSTLRTIDKAILTPHMVGQSIESEVVLRAAAVENIVRPMEGKPPEYVRNPDVLPEWRKRWGAPS
jgi:phosphoglycerate dehydrogenase-like enzyme